MKEFNHFFKRPTSVFLSTIAFSLVKLLLLKTYRSTDFEVHRNWLALTHSLPLKEWYLNKHSQWTLDYPPLFAWFEYLLSHLAVFFDPKMLKVENLDYNSDMTILFQRLTVIFTDLVFAYSLNLCVIEVTKRIGRKNEIELPLFMIIFANAGLLIVDHIHFQYNGFLFGILFLSIARLLQNRELESAFWFSVLLNLKHIYLYIAPAYFVYLLRSYCLSTTTRGQITWRSYTIERLFKLAAIVLGVFTISFGPFVAHGQLKQVLSRLFPFKRGLSHAYWAPNFWALYNFADKILAYLGSYLGILHGLPKGSMTGGLVQESEHLVLYSVPPFFTFVLTAIAMMPCLISLWQHAHEPWHFVKVVTMCGFCSFLFGWHVHEKAILLVTLPLGLFFLFSRTDVKLYFILTTVGNFSLFPLIFTSHETILKVTILLLHTTFTWSFIRRFFKIKNGSKVSFQPILSSFESLYLYGLVPLFLYEQIFHRLIGLESALPFMPLMLISVYCSVGIFLCWILFYRHLLIGSKHKGKSK